MPNLSVNYLGLPLKNPLIASSSGLTNSVHDIIELEKHGVGAVVLKSLFEEEIVTELSKKMHERSMENYTYPETMGFYEDQDVEDTLTSYLKLISDCKKEVNIPIIASINCISADSWPYFAKSLEDAGADAIELNIFVLPFDIESTEEDTTQIYFNIIEAVKKEVTIPVSIKISSHFTNITGTIKRLSETGIKGIVLFNRYYSPDIDIDNFVITTDNKFSNPNDYNIPLRWIGLLSDRVACDLSASTGVHDSKSLIKMLLAGAQTVQVASTLYKNGFAQINIMLDELNKWLKKNNIDDINEIIGKLSQSKTTNAGAYMRIQFMKHFSEKG